MKRIKSKLFSLNTWDAVKAAIVGILTTFVASLMSIWTIGTFPTKEQILSVLASAIVGYLAKNFFTNSQGLPKPEPQTDETIPPASTPADRV